MTATYTYTAEQARRDYPKPWIHRSECLDLCDKFGFTESMWRTYISSQIPKHPLDGKGWTRYDRDTLIRILQG